MWEMMRDENHLLTEAGLADPTVAAWAGVATGTLRANEGGFLKY